MAIAHPAAVVLALLLLRAQKVGKIARAVATVFEPASEHGKPGHGRTARADGEPALVPATAQNVFDAQVAFNLLDRYGEKSPPPLASVEDRILRHFRSIVRDKVAVPSLMLLQAPIFHGHAFSVYIETGPIRCSWKSDCRARRQSRRCVQGSEESPSNVNAAGQEQIQVFVRRDSQRRQWLLAVGRLRQPADAPCGGRVRREHDRGRAREGRCSEARPARRRSLSAAASPAAAACLRELRLSHQRQGCAPAADVHTIYVPAFANATHTYRLGTDLDRAVVQELRSRTNYRSSHPTMARPTPR